MSCCASRGSSRPRTSTFSSWADLLPSAHPNEIVQLTDLVTARRRSGKGSRSRASAPACPCRVSTAQP